MNYLESVISQAVFAAGLAPIMAALAGTLAVVITGFLFAKFLVDRVLPYPDPCQYADMAGFERVHPDGVTIHCQKSRMVRIWSLQGLDHANLSVPARNLAFESRCRALTNFSRLQPAPIVRFLSFRDPDTQGPGTSTNSSKSQRQEDPVWPVAGMLRRKWQESFRDKPVYRNRHYLLVDCPNTERGLRSLDAAAGIVTSSLQEYHPTALRCARDPKNPDASHLLEPICRLLSPASESIPRGVPNAWLPEMVCTNTLEYLGRGMFTFTSGTRKLYMCVVGIRRLPDVITEQPILGVSGLDVKCTILHTLRPVATGKAVLDLKIKIRRMDDGKDANTSKRTSFEMLNDVLQYLDGSHASGRSSRLHDYSSAIFVYAESREEMKENLESVYRVLVPADIAPVTEGLAAESCWWQSIPGNNLYPRGYRFLSEQAAALILPEEIPAGQQRSDWSPEPLMLARTIQNSAYGLHLHPTPAKEAPAHTVIIAPTGRGKTTLVSMIAVHVLGLPDASVQMFDSNLGCESFVRCCGGSYLDFMGTGGAQNQGLQKAALNPLQVEDSPGARAFLQEWLLSLIDHPDPEDRSDIGRCLEMVFTRFHREDRSLRNIHLAAFPPGSRARTYLESWVDPEQPYGNLFNADLDSIQQIVQESPVPLIGYDCTEAFANKTLAGPLISYLTWRIRQITPGKPMLMFIDETAPMLQNEEFRRSYIAGLQEGRKLRHAWVSAFQRPNAIRDCGDEQISQVIRGQCPTIIFSQNPQAQPEDYSDFELSDGELAFVLGRKLVESRHAFLVKRYDGPHTAILDMDLSPLGGLTQVFSSGRASVQSLRSAIQAAETEGQGVLQWLNLAGDRIRKPPKEMKQIGLG